MYEPQRAASSRSERRTCSRRIALGAVLDQAQVELDDVEAELAQQAQAGVAGPNVVGRHAHACALKRGQVALQLGEILDVLTLGQLDDNARRLDALREQHVDDPLHREVRRLEEAR